MLGSIYLNVGEITYTPQQTATELHREIIQKNMQKNKIPAFVPCLSQSINQEEMSDKSSEGCFDRVDKLCC